MLASGGPWRQITDNPGEDFGVSWSPDGTRIASAAERPDGGGTLISPTDGGPARLIRASAGTAEFSPLDDRIAITNSSSLSIMRESSAAPPVKIADGDYWGTAIWAPDAKSLLVAVTRDGDRVVVSIAADGTHERRLTNFSGRRGTFGGLFRPTGNTSTSPGSKTSATCGSWTSWRLGNRHEVQSRFRTLH